MAVGTLRTASSKVLISGIDGGGREIEIDDLAEARRLDSHLEEFLIVVGARRNGETQPAVLDDAQGDAGTLPGLETLESVGLEMDRRFLAVDDEDIGLLGDFSRFLEELFE